MERRYTELIKSSTAYATLMRDVKTDALSHAYLLTGEDSVSLDLLCDMFLAAAVGARYENGVYNRTLADIIYLPEDGEKVLVKDVNFLTETAFVTPTELTKKFYIIDRGETMNEASQNKLLKTLEEPPAVTVVVIKAANETKILPTVLSRCRKVELSPFPSADLKKELTKYYPDDERMYLALEACRGRIERAEKILAQPVYTKLFSIALDIVLKLDGSGGAAEYMFKLNDYRDNLDDIIDFIQLILLSGVRVACGAAKADEIPYDAAKVAERFPASVAVKETQVLDRARRRLELNCSVSAVIDEMLFSFLEVRAKWK